VIITDDKNFNAMKRFNDRIEVVEGVCKDVVKNVVSNGDIIMTDKLIVK